MSIRVEAVTVCVGYADFLAETLRENLPHLDHIVVVTSPSDEETHKVCRRNSVQYVMSDDYRRNGTWEGDQATSTVFNKGRMIRRAFDQIGGQDWVLHLDADIVLPRGFRRLLDVANLDSRCIYGADRQDVVGWEAWQRLKSYAGPWSNHSHENAHWFHPGLKMTSRWVSSIHGFAPIGFFQLFHGSELIKDGYHVRNYPTYHGDAARSDVQFALQWDRQNRHIIPELVVLHLNSEDAPLGTNWSGRKTKQFSAQPSAAAHHRPSCPPYYGCHEYVVFDAKSRRVVYGPESKVACETFVRANPGLRDIVVREIRDSP